MDADEQDIFKKVFHQYVFKTAYDKLLDYGSFEGLDSFDGFESGAEKEWVAMIRVTGKDFKFSFRTQFNDSDSMYITKQKLGEENGNDPLLGCDFLKEYCNLTAGRVRNSMLGLKIENKLSLPLVMKKKLDASFTIRQSPLVMERAFTLRWPQGSVECSYIIELLDQQITKQIQNINDLGEDNGLVEYL